MNIKIFGTGCPKCNTTYETVKKAVEQLNVNAEIEKITDINEISEWVFVTPGIAINDEIVFEGKVPTVEEVVKALKEYM